MFHLFKEQQKQINQIGKEYNLKLIVLHGSCATSQAHKKSDVDIAVLGYKPIGFDDQLKLIGDFCHLFKTNEADVKTLHHKDILFKYEVMKDAILLYGDEDDFNEFKIYAINSYLDAEDLFVLERQIINKRQEHLMSNIKNYD